MKTLTNLPEKLKITKDKVYEVTIVSETIKPFKIGKKEYYYIHVIYNNKLHTLFLDNGLDKAINRFVKRGNKLVITKKVKDNMIEWHITEIIVSQVSSKRTHPPKLRLELGQEVQVEIIRPQPIRGENEYGHYVIYRVKHDGVEKSLFVNDDFISEFNKLNSPNHIKVKLTENGFNIIPLHENNESNLKCIDAETGEIDTSRTENESQETSYRNEIIQELRALLANPKTTKKELIQKLTDLLNL